MSTPGNTARQDGLKNFMEAYEQALITNALKITFGNKMHAARILRITRRIMDYKVRKYAINLRVFKQVSLQEKKVEDRTYATEESDELLCMKNQVQEESRNVMEEIIREGIRVISQTVIEIKDGKKVYITNIP